MKKSLTTLAAVAASFTPALAFAQTASTPSAGGSFFVKVQGFINQAIFLLFSVATLVFLYGVVAYVIAGGDEKKGSAARSYMMWGIIGLAMMAAVWGFVNLVVETLGLSGSFEKPTYIDQLNGS